MTSQRINGRGKTPDGRIIRPVTQGVTSAVAVAIARQIQSLNEGQGGWANFHMKVDQVAFPKVRMKSVNVAGVRERSRQHAMRERTRLAREAKETDQDQGATLEQELNSATLESSTAGQSSDGTKSTGTDQGSAADAAPPKRGKGRSAKRTVDDLV